MLCVFAKNKAHEMVKKDMGALGISQWGVSSIYKDNVASSKKIIYTQDSVASW